MFRALAVMAVLYSYYEIKTGLPQVASPRVGLQASLWISLWVEAFITLLLLAVPWIARWSPQYVHFGSTTLADYTARQRERIMPLLKNMVGLMALATNLLLGFDIHQRLALVRSRSIGPPAPWFVLGILASDALILWHYWSRIDEEAGPE